MSTLVTPEFASPPKVVMAQSTRRAKAVKKVILESSLGSADLALALRVSERRVQQVRAREDRDRAMRQLARAEDFALSRAAVSFLSGESA